MTLTEGFYTTDYQYDEVEDGQRIWKIAKQDKYFSSYYEWCRGEWTAQKSMKNDQQWGWPTWTLKKITEKEAKQIMVKCSHRQTG